MTTCIPLPVSCGVGGWYPGVELNGLSPCVGVTGPGDGMMGFLCSNYPVPSLTSDGTSTTLLIGNVLRPNGIYGGWARGYFVCSRPNLLSCGVSLRAGNRVSVERGAVSPGERQNACDVVHFWSLHRVAGTAFADGSVRFLLATAPGPGCTCNSCGRGTR
jgi:hypothetical protein